VSDLPVAPPRFTVVPRIAASHAPAPGAAVDGGAPSACEPPYVVDDAGVTRFKLECFAAK